MGAGQIGGIATLLDMDFNNAAGFQGAPAKITEGQFIVHYMSHAMMFCVGALLEAHIVLTPASCVVGERYKFKVYGGTHQFLENTGISREVQHLCSHRGYNHTGRWQGCSSDNLALLCLNHQFYFNKREQYTQFIINRVRYGIVDVTSKDANCRFYGWGSRRNGYLIPLLIHLYEMDISVLPSEDCAPIFNTDDHYLCVQQPKCKSEKHGALCPDDFGSVIVCSGNVVGMMVSRLIDRPCGVGFIDIRKYNKFITCGVDDSRDVIDHDEYMAFEFDHTKQMLAKPSVLTTPHDNVTQDDV